MMDQNIFSSSCQKKENFEWKKLSICKVLFSNPRQNGLKQWLPSQSAPSILVLKTWVGFWPWKKTQVYNIDCKKQGAKNGVQKTVMMSPRFSMGWGYPDSYLMNDMWLVEYSFVSLFVNSWGVSPSECWHQLTS